MTAIAAAALLTALIVIHTRVKVFHKASQAPALLLAAGMCASLVYRAMGAPHLPSEWTAAGADALLAALAFVAAAQFRVSKLAKACPASFRLTVGGAPLFLIIGGLGAFILVPQLPLTAAFLVAGALVLNGAAFDRRAVADTPAPAVVKAAVRLESAAALALGLPIAVVLESIASAAPDGIPAIAPLYEMSLSIFSAFALGGGLGLAAATIGKHLKYRNNNAALAITSAALAYFLSPIVGAHGVIAAAAAGLLWGEDTQALVTTRVRMRRVVERNVAPLAYLAFGAALGPRILQADLLSVLFAMSAVSIMRAGPRLAALKQTSLPKESQMFLAWFGGAPGAASALFLISLFDAPSIVAQDAVLTVGALAVAFGVVAARASARPLVRVFLKETALARKRALYAE